MRHPRLPNVRFVAHSPWSHLDLATSQFPQNSQVGRSMSSYGVPRFLVFSAGNRYRGARLMGPLVGWIGLLIMIESFVVRVGGERIR